MVQGVHHGGAIRATNIHTQVECRGVHEVTPCLTNMRELAPPKSHFPSILLMRPIVVEYAEEYIVVEPIDSRV